MKSKIILTSACLALAAASLLVACGGGSSGSSSGGTTSAAATSTTSGVLSAFGSVIVNGHEYATGSSTSVTDGDADDAASTLGALRVGMTVDVDATGQTAGRVRYTSAVRGEVDAIDTSASTLTVLGQTVQVSGATLFAGSRTSAGTTTALTQLSDIGVGDYVIVYGVLDCTSTGANACAAGSTAGSTRVLASLIDEPGAAGAYRVEGYAENAGTASFTINGLAVDIATSGTSATVCSPSPCAIANGDFVAVRSATAPTTVSGTLTLAATRVKTTSAAPVLVAGATASLEGPVALLDTTAETFSVRGVTIDGSALAATVASLVAGEIVEVTGTVTASGSIAATAITVEHHATFSITAPLSADSASADTITLLGQTFDVNSSTRFVDRVGNVRPFNLGNFTTVLALQDQLIVSGYTTASGNVATRVERVATPASPTVAVQGVVSGDSSAAGTVTIGGITATLGTSTALAYAGAGASPTLAGFFNAITVQSSVVAIVGTAGSGAGTIAATSATVMPSTCLWASGPF
jgi:hypothetical protein